MGTVNDFAPGLVIDVTSGEIGQDYRGAVGQRAGDDPDNKRKRNTLNPTY